MIKALKKITFVYYGIEIFINNKLLTFNFWTCVHAFFM